MMHCLLQSFETQSSNLVMFIYLRLGEDSEKKYDRFVVLLVSLVMGEISILALVIENLMDKHEIFVVFSLI